ncbi:DUF317 domain-containing protein [Streptomyces sp. NPDC101234]|uniref:DUF317 domain-containing protein n=1 Tax=Streptomyces sp. NPDC101234 TaxID=3366138 RepID=UPI0037F733D3
MPWCTRSEIREVSNQAQKIHDDIRHGHLLIHAGWEHTVDGRWIRWTNPSRDAGIRFDAFAAHQPNSNLTTWTLWSGPSTDHPTWTVTASPYTPSSLLADLAETLAHDTGTRHAQPAGRARKTSLTTSPPATAPVTAGAAASRSR